MLNHKVFSQITLGVFVSLLTSDLRAESLSSVNLDQAGSAASAVPATGMITRTGEGLTLRIYNSCFGTNLRHVSNPLAARAIVTSQLAFSIGTKSYTMMVKYPSTVALQTSNTQGVTVSDLANLDAADFQIKDSDGKVLTDAKAGLYGNLIEARMPSVAVTMVDPTATSGKAVLNSSAFSQEVLCGGKKVQNPKWANAFTYECGSYMGKTGTISANIKGVNVASDNSMLEISVAFPGEAAFCGGYWSPLMLFFDDQRPLFSAVSEFPLNPVGRTRWPEAGSPGYLLAIDRNGDGKISQRDELFGDQLGKFKNGFEALKKLDSNSDQVIDAKDKDFTRLLLWNDANANGVSEPSELRSLADFSIVSLSLRYKRVSIPIGRFAEEKETADFIYLKKDPKSRKDVPTQGKIVDVWFAPAPERN